MIIDIHTHVCNKETLETYKKKSKNLVSKIIALPFFENPPKVGEEIETLLEFSEKEPSIFPTGCINMKNDIEKQLEFHEKLFLEKKICAIKLFPGYQQFYPFEKEVFPIARLCEKYNKPLLFHSGDFYDPKNESFLKYSHPSHIDELAVKSPGTKIIISHFGFPYFIETANIVSKNKNVFTDISGTIDNWGISKKEVKILTKQYISDLKRVFNYYPDVKRKVMFASDYSGEKTDLNLVIPYIDVIKNLFKKREREKAFYCLAEDLFFK